jgi:hypothetical protein
MVGSKQSQSVAVWSESVVRYPCVLKEVAHDESAKQAELTFDNHRVLPVGFVPYGLAQWDGTRRLDFWQYSADSSRANQIWLGHDDERGCLTVGTFDPLDRRADSVDLAEELTIKLVSIGLPNQDAPRPVAFGHRLVDHAMNLAARRDRWPTTAVVVDGRPEWLRYQVFAGCWAATVDGHTVGALGWGDPPELLTLVPFADTTPYGFDVTAGVRFVDMRGPDSWPWATDWHPDHFPLL